MMLQKDVNENVNGSHIDELLKKFKPILKRLILYKSYEDKINALNENLMIRAFLDEKPILKAYLDGNATGIFSPKGIKKASQIQVVE